MMKKQVFDSQEYILVNGIRLVTIKKDTNIASIHVGIEAGSLDEMEDENGICHFIEHMLFKGTKKRDNNKINKDLEERAGTYNAYTDYTSTVLSVTVLEEEFEDSIEILSDIIMNPTFPEEEIEKERGVILTEIKTCVDDIEDYSLNKVHELAFKKSPLKYDVIGTEKNVKNFTKEQLEKFYDANFRPDRCIISIVSSLKHNEMKNIIEKYFGKWSKSESIKRDVIIEKNRAVEKISYKENIEQNTLVYLYTFHGLSRREELALDILNHKLGESPNSILFRALREERGLAYYVYTEMDTTEGIKTYYIYTAVGEDDIWEVKEIIEDCIKRINTREIVISKRDIELMKKVIKTSIALILEDSEGLGSYVLNQKLMGKRIDAFSEDLKNLDYIEANDVYRVAEKVLKKPTIHILVNKK